MNILKILFLSIALVLFTLIGNLASVKNMKLTRYRSGDGENVDGKRCRVHSLKIDNCGIQVSRFDSKLITVSFVKTCKVEKSNYTFYFGKEDVYSYSFRTTRPEIKISTMRHVLEKNNEVFVPGTQYIYATLDAQMFSGDKMSIKSAQCNFFIIYENATADIGEHMRTVPNDIEFEVAGFKSINNDVEEEQIGLLYRWHCTDNLGFCRTNDLGSGDSVVVPANYVKTGNVFVFQLLVKTEFTDYQEAKQIITVDPLRPYVVNCIENCGDGFNDWNAKSHPLLLATCQFSCERYIGKMWVRIHSVQGDWKFPEMVRRPTVFHDVVPGTEYEVVVVFQYKNSTKVNVGHQIFKSDPSPQLENCKTIPAQGNPLTRFKIHCDYKREDTRFFELEIKLNYTYIFSNRSVNLEDFEFIAPVGSELVVTIHSKIMETSQTIKMNVTEALPVNTTDMEEYANQLLGGNISGLSNLENLIKKERYDDAFQTLDFMVREFLKLQNVLDPDSKVMLALKQVLLSTSDMIPIQTFYSGLSMSSLVSLLFNIRSIDSDPEADGSPMAKCLKVSRHVAYAMEMNIDYEFQKSDMHKLAHNLFSCKNSELLKKYNWTKYNTAPIEVNTEFPLNSNLSENNIENYPEYILNDDLEDIGKNIMKYSEYGIEICRDVGFSLQQSVSEYDFLSYITSEDRTVAVFRVQEASMAEVGIILLGNIIFVPPHSLGGRDVYISAVLCLYDNNPFWPATNELKIVTTVLDLTLRDEFNLEDLHKIGTSGTLIKFNINNNTDQQLQNTKFSLKKIEDFSTENQDELHIFRIGVKAEQSTFIELLHLQICDIVKVVVLEMERPTFEHFSQAVTLSLYDNRIFLKNRAKEDTWYFLSFLPADTKTMMNKTEINVTFIVYSPGCVKWNYETNIWEHACSVHNTSNSDIYVSCVCTHFSTLAGSMTYNSVKEIPKFVGIDFSLEMRMDLLCITVVCIVLLIYCLLIICPSRREESVEEAVYFLSDVPSKNLYGYLIEITTGRNFYSGTSSNIVIQIYGTEGKSKEHVLNFPDPCLKLLQRQGQNLFVLGTYAYLGRLLKINIWTDCSGSFPNWYCKEIRICDLQTKQWWIFSVEHWLKLDGTSPTLFLSVAASINNTEPSDDHNKNTKLLDVLLGIIYTENTMWSLSTKYRNPEFGYAKRLTVLLSIVLTLMMIIMAFYGRPEFLARDTITSDYVFMFSGRIVYIALLSAIITFLLHIGIVMALRSSKRHHEANKMKEGESLRPIINLMLWVVIIGSVFLQTHILIIYGKSIVYPITWQWLTSFLISLILYIFFLERVWSLCMSLVCHIEASGKLRYRRIMKNIDKQRKYLYNNFGKGIYRPIMTHLYKNMSRFEYMTKRFHFGQKLRMVWYFQDFVVGLLFIIFLYVILMEERDLSNDVAGNKEAYNLVFGHRNKKLLLAEVEHYDEFLDYLADTVIPHLQSYKWYGRYLSKSPGMTSDKSNRLLGIIRLHQHRNSDHNCNLPDIIRFVNTTCISSTYFFAEDTSRYTAGWDDLTSEITQTRQTDIWFYNDGVGDSYYGQTGFYPKGGYFAYLGRNMKNSLINLDYIKRRSWLDISTRAVIVELVLYNVNTNLFHFISIMAERTPAGYINKELTIHTTRIILRSSSHEIIYVLCTLSFIVLVVSLIIRIASRLIRTRGFREEVLCHTLDIILASLGIAWIIAYLDKIYLIQHFTKEIVEQSSNNFVEYYDILANVLVMRYIASLIIFLCIIRLFMILRTTRMFRAIENTIFLSLATFKYMFLCYLLWCFAFAGMFFVLFGSKIKSFNKGYFSMETLIMVTAGNKIFNDFLTERIETGNEYLFVIMFYLFSFFFIVAFVVILVVNYIKAKEFAFEERTTYSFKDFVVEKFQGLKRFAMISTRKYQLRAGGKARNDRNETVTPKTDNIRYKNCVRVDSNRMAAMGSVVYSFVMNKKQTPTLRPAKYAQMLKIVRNLFNKKQGENEYFFVKHTEETGCVFVDNNRIVKMENLVKRMLMSEEEKKSFDEQLQTKEVLTAENKAKLQEMNYRMKQMLRVVQGIDIKTKSK